MITYFSSTNLLQCDVQLDAYAHLFLFHVKSSTTWCTCSHISVLHQISYNLIHMLTYFCSTSTIIWCTTWCICSPISHRIITILTFYIKFSSQLSVGVLLKSVTYREGSVNSHAKIYAPSKGSNSPSCSLYLETLWTSKPPSRRPAAGMESQSWSCNVHIVKILSSEG